MSAQIYTGTYSGTKHTASMLNTLKSQWRKLVYLRSTWITAAVGFMLIALLGYTVGFGLAATIKTATPDLPPDLTAAIGDIAPGTPNYKIIVWMLFQLTMLFTTIPAILIASGEYSKSTIRVSLTATPNRTVLFTAKALVAVLYTAVFSVIAYLLSLGFITLGLGERSGIMQVQLGGSFLLGMGIYVLAACALAIIGMCVGLLLRSSAGAISLVLTWYLVLPSLIQLLPKSIKWIGDYMPYILAGNMDSNGFGGAGGTSISMTTANIGITVWVVLAVAVSLFVYHKRDA